MNLSISNIAWNVWDDDSVAKILQKHSISNIDIAPGKYFDVEHVNLEHVKTIKNKWQDYGISIIGMQSLLYGSNGLNVFDESCHSKFFARIEKLCSIANVLGIKYITFGSPKNRIIPDSLQNNYIDIASKFFGVLGDIAKAHYTTICLEPNPTYYGGNFMVDSKSTSKIVSSVNHSNIKMQLDIGACFMNNEFVPGVVYKYYDIIGHVHISEPMLAPILAFNHSLISKYVQQFDYCTIEMLCNDLDILEKSIIFVKNNYEENE